MAKWLTNPVILLMVPLINLGIKVNGKELNHQNEISTSGNFLARN